jgi:hypothetical protein
VSRPPRSRRPDASHHGRHLNAGQRAILLALAYPEPKRGMHSQLQIATEVDRGELSRARTICKWARLEIYA